MNVVVVLLEYMWIFRVCWGRSGYLLLSRYLSMKAFINRWLQPIENLLRTATCLQICFLLFIMKSTSFQENLIYRKYIQDTITKYCNQAIWHLGRARTVEAYEHYFLLILKRFSSKNNHICNILNGKYFFNQYFVIFWHFRYHNVDKLFIHSSTA